jgi:hypothetical protein
MITGISAMGQNQNVTAKQTGTFDVAITYNADRSSSLGGNDFWMQGGGVQLHGRFWKGLGAVADVSAAHTNDMTGTGVGLDIVTATFGPRYTFALPKQHAEFFAQALGGVANGFNSTFPGFYGATSVAQGMAIDIGGGVNVPLSRRFAVRALQASWIRTDLSNTQKNVENHLQLGSGIVVRF